MRSNQLSYITYRISIFLTHITLKANTTICRHKCLTVYFYNDMVLTFNHSIISLSSYAYLRSPFSAEDNLQPLFYQYVKELFSVFPASLQGQAHWPGWVPDNRQFWFDFRWGLRLCRSINDIGDGADGLHSFYQFQILGISFSPPIFIHSLILFNCPFSCFNFSTLSSRSSVCDFLILPWLIYLWLIWLITLSHTPLQDFRKDYYTGLKEINSFWEIDVVLSRNLISALYSSIFKWASIQAVLRADLKE